MFSRRLRLRLRRGWVRVGSAQPRAEP